MSTKIMAKCWALQMHGVAKSVLLSLADQANDDGVCWPSVGSIAKRTCWDERTIRRAIADLESMHAVQLERVPGKSTSYRLTPDSVTPLSESHPCQTVTTPLTEDQDTPVRESPPYTLNRHRSVNEPSVSMSGKPDEARLLLAFLNEKAGRNFRPTGANLKPIQARLREGYSVDDCRMVIAQRVRKWSADDKMREFLRPATLFNATKFNQYAGELTHA